MQAILLNIFYQYSTFANFTSLSIWLRLIQVGGQEPSDEHECYLRMTEFEITRSRLALYRLLFSKHFTFPGSLHWVVAGLVSNGLGIGISLPLPSTSPSPRLQVLSDIRAANILFMVTLPLGHFYGEFRTNLAEIRKIRHYQTPTLLSKYLI